MTLKQTIENIIEAEGIPCLGFVPFSAVLPLLECRAKVRLPEHAETVIVCLFPYVVKEPPKRNISRYAVVADYHIVAAELLSHACDRMLQKFPGFHFEPFVDNSPIREVTAAVLAGLGMQGKNGLLIHPDYGSYVFIGEIVTDLVIETQPQPVRPCLGCQKCAVACPAGAITEKGIDREKCLSHITQKKGVLSDEEIVLIRQGKLLWGCDTCQEVCPYNQKIPQTPIQAFYDDIEPFIVYDRIDELVKTRAFGFRGSGVVKRNYEILYGKPIKTQEKTE